MAGNGCWITLDELAARREEWRELAGGSDFPNAFASPAWVLAWWRHYGEGHEPWSLAVLDADGSLRGLALLALRRRRHLRALVFAGGRWNGIESLLCRHGGEAAVVGALLDALRQRRAEWDVWRIRRLPRASLLAGELISGGDEVRSAGHDLPLQPYLPLPESGEQLEGQLPGKQRSELRRKCRRLLELGAQARLVSDPDEVRGAIATMLELHRDRAHDKHERHRHMDARFARFVADAVCGSLPDGARLWTLELEGTPLTMRLSLVQGPREQGYLTGMSDEHATLSPGRVLERHALLAAIGEGRTELDYGSGRERYKYGWGAVDRELARIVVASPTARGRLAGAMAASELHLRHSAPADMLRQLRGLTPERASASAPAVTAPPAHAGLATASPHAAAGTRLARQAGERLATRRDDSAERSPRRRGRQAHRH